MFLLPPIMVQISESHRQRLAWFADRAGTNTDYPSLSKDEFRLISTPKGIYKPEGWKHALSVKKTLGSRYKDGGVVDKGSGQWSFTYHEERVKERPPSKESTNLALKACIEDRVPVGVIFQELPKDGYANYHIVGLAQPVDWQNGYFYFESVDGPTELPDGTVTGIFPADAGTEPGQQVSVNLPADDYDARRRVYRAVVARRGQAAFRQDLLRAYGNVCAATGCTAEAVLEAAHLIPYRGPDSNAVTNGLLLRADVHTLLDLGLLAINPETRLISTSMRLDGTEYASLDGRRIADPLCADQQPAQDALRNPWQRFQDAERLR